MPVLVDGRDGGDVMDDVYIYIVILWLSGRQTVETSYWSHEVKMTRDEAMRLFNSNKIMENSTRVSLMNTLAMSSFKFLPKKRYEIIQASLFFKDDSV